MWLQPVPGCDDLMKQHVNISSVFVKCWFARAFRTKKHRCGDLSHRSLFPHGSGAWKSKFKVLAVLAFSEASLLGLRMAAFLLCLPMALALCMHIPDISSSSYKDANPTGLGLHFYDFI